MGVWYVSSVYLLVARSIFYVIPIAGGNLSQILSLGYGALTSDFNTYFFWFGFLKGAVNVLQFGV